MTWTLKCASPPQYHLPKELGPKWTKWCRQQIQEIVCFWQPWQQPFPEALKPKGGKTPKQRKAVWWHKRLLVVHFSSSLCFLQKHCDLLLVWAMVGSFTKQECDYALFAAAAAITLRALNTKVQKYLQFTSWNYTQSSWTPLKGGEKENGCNSRTINHCQGEICIWKRYTSTDLIFSHLNEGCCFNIVLSTCTMYYPPVSCKIPDLRSNYIHCEEEVETVVRLSLRVAIRYFSRRRQQTKCLFPSSTTPHQLYHILPVVYNCTTPH